LEGIEVFYFSKTFSKYALKIAAKENGVSWRSFTEKDLMLLELSSSYKHGASKFLAKHIAKSLVSNMKRNGYKVKNRGVNGAPLYVLAGSLAPSVLVEIGFLSNPLERKKLLSKKYRKEIARGIYKGIVSWVKQNQI
jgi:N-acetylmuramoyl-L-alanine amidase